LDVGKQGVHLGIAWEFLDAFAADRFRLDLLLRQVEQFGQSVVGRRRGEVLHLLAQAIDL
jgi:hypothetical protein